MDRRRGRGGSGHPGPRGPRRRPRVRAGPALRARGALGGAAEPPRAITWPSSHPRRPSPAGPRSSMTTPAPSPAPPTGPIVVSLGDLPRLPGPCVVLANELLDNLPFGLLERTADGWAEVHVGLERDRLVEILVPTAGPVARRSRSAPECLDAGRRRRLGARRGRPGRAGWARPRVRLRRHDAASSPLRPWAEWVRTYRQHARGGSPLEGLGTQDITCEVAVDQLPTPSSDRSQADWLRAHGIDDARRRGPSDLAGAGRHRRPRGRAGPQPDHRGRGAPRPVRPRRLPCPRVARADYSRNIPRRGSSV